MFHAVKKFLFGPTVDIERNIRVFDYAIGMLDLRYQNKLSLFTCLRIENACREIGVPGGTYAQLVDQYSIFIRSQHDPENHTAPDWWNHKVHYYDERRAALCAFRDHLQQECDAKRGKRK